jgi:YD repeat-containing protein
MRRRFFLASTSLAAMTCAVVVSAQSSTETYSYDALGRLVATVDAKARTNYDYDDAANRERVTQRFLFPVSWQAAALPHNIGYAEADGWAANVTMGAQHMTYGPYTTAIPAGSHVAVWRVMIDSVAGPANDNIITIDVFDATTGQVLAIETLERRQWVSNMTYQVFEIPFEFDASRVGHAVELRTFYHSGAYVRVQKIGYYAE